MTNLKTITKSLRAAVDAGDLHYVHVNRRVHRDIEDILPDELTRRISVTAIAAYEAVYGKKMDQEHAVCIEVQGMDVWSFVVHLGPGEWEVLILPDKEAQEYMQDW